ncbi:BEL1-LIKE HOMEODOMAIN PROTEIN 10 [Salix purpurea]|uniref:BEL1-LIKE HOMEODOMAIN PROTEIN 10 n=1 Tax=Salix purpurea TaxID=77065 RepID=A0A9Q0SPS1_SALPP|nr:BEL1-LIKE HOMEODOMAIN PROTEIN 10 [Salix purpurea]
MATYYRTSSSQNSNLQTLFTGDQKGASYSELPSDLSSMKSYTSHTPAAGSYSEILYGGSLSSQNGAELSSCGARDEIAFIPPTSDTMNLQSAGGQLNTAAGNLVGDSVSGNSQAVPPWMQLGIPDCEQNFHSQGLPLRLGMQEQSAVSMPSLQYDQYPNRNFPSSLCSNLLVPEKWTLTCEGDESNQRNELREFEGLSGFAGSNHNPIKTESPHNPQYIVGLGDMPADMNMYGLAGYANTLLNSRYLKSVQHLLDEMINVKKALKQPQSNKCSGDNKENDRRPSPCSMLPSSNEKPSDPTESTAESTPGLSPVERQDLQNKKTKLLSMLEEVDRKYKQYYHQMQAVALSFDMVAGHGAAKSYTELALQTISRHFRCLRDAISGQIEVIMKRLGEQGNSTNGQGGIPRLRYVDHQTRQQRALQQLGVMRHAWRPQRGLPESSVSVLRAWLFEHFLHPYPSDSEKTMLASQAGLTRSQVANWFINARVRLWKPMVEDMYKEEFGDSDTNSKSSLDETTKSRGDKSDNLLTSENRLRELYESVTSAGADIAQPGKPHDIKSNHILELEMKEPLAKIVLENGSQGPNVAESDIMKFPRDRRLNIDDDHNFCPRDNMPCDQNGDGNPMSAAAAAYDVSHLKGFAAGSQMSLALGLQSNDSDSCPTFDGAHMRGKNTSASSVGHDEVDHHCMDTGKQHDRIANSHRLHDFVV